MKRGIGIVSLLLATAWVVYWNNAGVYLGLWGFPLVYGPLGAWVVAGTYLFEESADRR